MKKFFRIFAGILATAFTITGCSTYAQGGYNNGYYGNGYGDGQPNNDYYYNNNNNNYNQQDPNMAYQQPAGQQPMGFNDFYNQLSPYGMWVNIAPYGQVWVANVPNFQPYSTNGYWSYTTYGWTWVSNYSWGWAPFHYGRWGYTKPYGWYWVPGYVWGPAWVAWSSGSDMYGWAPLMPGMSFGVSLSINLFPSSYWTFMPGRYMGMNNIGGYYMDRSRNKTIINNTTIINNYGTEGNRRYSMGPSANDVQRYTGRTVQPMRVTNVTESGRAGVGDNELRVYRPVTRTANTSPNNNRATNGASGTNRTGTATPQTRTQQNQQWEYGSSAPQTRTQPTQQPTNRAVSPQQTRGSQGTQQNMEQRTYQRNSEQPKVKNNAAPQTSRQIQAAQKEYGRNEQQRSEASSRSGGNTRERR